MNQFNVILLPNHDKWVFKSFNYILAYTWPQRILRALTHYCQSRIRHLWKPIAISGIQIYLVVSTYDFHHTYVFPVRFSISISMPMWIYLFFQTRLWISCVHYVQYLLKISCIHGWIIRLSFELRFIPCETGLFAQWSIYMLIYCHWLVSAAATSQLHNFQLEHTYRKINSI